MSPSPVPRRTVLATAGLGAVGAASLVAAGPAADAAPRPGRPRPSGLRFGADRRFRVVQFNDTQDDERTDRRTVELIEKTLDREKPDFVVINGDVITGGCDTWLQAKQAVNNVVQPMERRGIAWALTLGNHDEDSGADAGFTEADLLRLYRSYRHNLNAADTPGLTGTSNTVIEVAGVRGDRAAYALWLMDSGRYAPETVAGQDFEGYPDWDWIRADQVAWYRETSQQLEQRRRRLVPGLMFFHIALWEHRFMWWGSVDGRTPADAARGRERHGIVGERNEDECPGPINSGMFNALLERGDVQGVFVGHDHVNTYVGDYYGVKLGYAPGTGFGAYGLSGAERNRLRGGRVFDLTLNADDSVDLDTRLVFAADLGIDLTANDQPMEPLPLPAAQQRI